MASLARMVPCHLKIQKLANSALCQEPFQTLQDVQENEERETH